MLDNVKGTSRYWKKAKMEMLAKLDNFGPFHIFYTLSCGDMRWADNFTSILREKGYNIIWNAGEFNLEEVSEVDIEVEFGPEDTKGKKMLRTFLEEEVDESIHEFIRDVFIATRNFMNRVKNFRKEVMLGQNNPMAIEHWSDKMEFQGRGAAHIHGVAWCNLEEVAKELKIEDIEEDSDEEFEKDLDQDDDQFEDKEDNNDNSKSFLEKAFDKLRIDEKLNKEEEKAMIAFADKFATCTLNPGIAQK